MLGKLTITIAKHLSLCFVLCAFYFIESRVFFLVVVFVVFHSPSKCIDPISVCKMRRVQRNHQKMHSSFLYFAFSNWRIWTTSKEEAADGNAERKRERRTQKRLINENLLHDFSAARRQWPTFCGERKNRMAAMLGSMQSNSVCVHFCLL